jgi:hypothetical protein
MKTKLRGANKINCIAQLRLKNEYQTAPAYVHEALRVLIEKWQKVSDYNLRD